MRLGLLLSLLLLWSCGTDDSETKNHRQQKSSSDATQQPGTSSENCVALNLTDTPCPPKSPEPPEQETPPPTEPPDPPTPAPTPGDTTNYQKDIAPIMATSCAVAGCHAGSRPAKSIGLDNVNGVIINFFDAISAIEKGKMPIDNYPKITATQLKTLKTWQAEGYPQ